MHEKLIAEIYSSRLLMLVYMFSYQQVTIPGDTGLIQFDEYKNRDKLSLSIMWLVEEGFIEVSN